MNAELSHKSFIIIFIFLSNCCNLIIECCEHCDPDESRDAVSIIKSRGFKVEVHYVTTEDGYILALHRIINPHLSQYNASLKPIILQHGLCGSSADFIINSPFVNVDSYEYKNKENIGNNLGFVLSLSGYDVWLSNSRGNTYSTNHTKLNTKDKLYWEFTFDEMAKYDLPAIINYVIKSTNSSDTAYVGYSQGTAIMFALLSTHPQYSQLIKPFIALAPVAYVADIISPIRYLSPLGEILRITGGEFLPSDKLMRILSDIVCDHELKFVCSNLMFLLCGFDAQQLNMTRLGVYFSHTPAGTSSWNVLHFSQLVESKQFRMFDFGKLENQRKYNQSSPPVYPLERINSTKIALIYSLNDWLADVNDVQLLKKNLNVTLLDDYLVPDKKWSHIDYVYGKDAGIMVYNKVLDILDNI